MSTIYVCTDCGHQTITDPEGVCPQLNFYVHTRGYRMKEFNPHSAEDIAAKSVAVAPPTPVGEPIGDPAAILLDQAKTIVTGARRQNYGTPEDNFAIIACLWDDYLRRRGAVHGGKDFHLQTSDVAVMMVLMKAARLAETPNHADSWRDIAGYAACGARASKADLS